MFPPCVVAYNTSTQCVSSGRRDSIPLFRRRRNSAALKVNRIAKLLRLLIATFSNISDIVLLKIKWDYCHLPVRVSNGSDAFRVTLIRTSPYYSPRLTILEAAFNFYLLFGTETEDDLIFLEKKEKP